jgi:hypothetical protein
VSVEVKLGTPEEGSRVAVVPAGRPEVDRLTVSLNPPIEATVTVALNDFP